MNRDRLVFSEKGKEEEEIFMMKRDGSQKTQLTNMPGFRSYQPNLSDDGQTIYFTSDREGLSRIFAIDMVTKKGKKITN